MMMYQFQRVVIIIMILIVLVFTPVWSQEEAGPVDKWKGEVRIDGGRPDPVTFDVRRDKGSYEILSIKYIDEDDPIKNFLWSKDIISFTWNLENSDVNCVLRKQDEAKYAGDCKFADSETSLGMTVIPKIKQESSEEPAE